MYIPYFLIISAILSTAEESRGAMIQISKVGQVYRAHIDFPATYITEDVSKLNDH